MVGGGGVIVSRVGLRYPRKYAPGANIQGGGGDFVVHQLSRRTDIEWKKVRYQKRITIDIILDLKYLYN